MSERFDWQTEEDDWEGVARDRTKRSGRRKWRWLVITVIAILTVTAVIYSQVQQQLTKIEESHIVDILSSYQLILDASEREDRELFRTMLSGADLTWAMAQQDLFARGWLDDKRAFGLNPLDGSPKILEVNPSPGLQSAEVVAEKRYTTTGQDDTHETITLSRVDIFRVGDRWLWSPPRDEYWGGNIDDHLSGRLLTFFSPQRDLKIADRLMRDIDGLLVAWCADAGDATCRDDLNVHVKLSRDPASLVDLSERFFNHGYVGKRLRFTGRAYNISLPTPSLVGIPQDEASYQALMRGYGRHIIGGIVAELLNEECCNNAETYQAVIRNNLAGMGLLPRVDDVNKADDSNPHWALHDMTLLCVDETSRSSNIISYDIREGNWHLDLDGRQLTSMRVMPDGRGILLQERFPTRETVINRIMLWRDGIEQVVFEIEAAPEEADMFQWEVQEYERLLVVEVPDIVRGASAYHTYDLSSCDPNGCLSVVNHSPGKPTWSPDNTQLLVREYGLIWLQQGFANTPIADGVAPFWIDDDNFGFVSQIGDEQLIVVQNDMSGDPHVILGTSSLKEALPEDIRPAKAAIGHVKASAIKGDIWLILAFGLTSDNRAGEAYIFSFDPKMEEITLLLHSEHIHSFSTSPGGEWLAINYYDPEIQQWMIRIYDLVTKTMWESKPQTAFIAQAPPETNWSTDGSELLVLNRGIVTIINPKLEAEWRLVLPEPGCLSAVLIDR